jgi:haloalkane dehalogenase
MIDMVNQHIATECPYPSQFIEVDNVRMHYLEAGNGDPILFLHGIPTSSYLWRNIIPSLAPLGHCLAVDLVGFGQSAKPDISYNIDQHIHYIKAFINKLALNNITLVMHGYGSIIGLAIAMAQPTQFKGLVFYEAFLRPFSQLDVSLPLQEQLRQFNVEGMEELSNQAISFVDQLIPQTLIRPLSDIEMDFYRQPFTESGAYKAIINYIHEMIDQQKQDHLNKIIENYQDKLCHSSLPKLLLYSLPGFITTMATIMWAKKHLPQLTLIEMGEELHLAQESNPELMANSISVWLQSIEQGAL